MDTDAARTQQRVFLSPPQLSGEEMRLIAEAFASNYIAPVGPMVDAFERELAETIGLPHTLGLSSGTAAMHLALRGVGVGPGDLVLASSLTFIGGVSPIELLGAEPMFVDSDRESWNMDPERLADALRELDRGGRRPKAVVPTDLYGQCVDLDWLLEICAPYDVPVVCDSAEAMGATYRGRHAGVGARAAVYSFNGNKIITTSGGGLLASEDRALVEHARFLSRQARDPAPHYEHTQLGFNYAMSNIVAAIGRGQLGVLKERVARRREIFATYEALLSDLPGLDFMPEAPHGRANRWLTVVLVTPGEFGADREQVRQALEAENIEARPVWKPMHLQPVFKGRRTFGGEVCEDLFDRGLCLPSGGGLTTDDQERVARVIRGCSRAV